MSYCPKCGFEYKPGINNCTDCGEKLLAELKSVNKEEDNREKIVSELKLLYIAKNMIHAKLLVETLEKTEFPALLTVNLDCF